MTDNQHMEITYKDFIENYLTPGNVKELIIEDGKTVIVLLKNGSKN